MPDLTEYLKNKKYSQNGEDGILEEIFKRLKIDKGYFVDVGAWDGKYLSNTYLFVEKGWEGLEIEGNPKYISKMHKLLPFNIKIYSHYIEPDKLDYILGYYDAPRRFDLLSIDIDTYDYWIWKNLTIYRPKVVIIESNSMEGLYIQPPQFDFKGKKGASPLALRDLGRRKGYTEVFFNGNLIFVDNKYYGNL